MKILYSIFIQKAYLKRMSMILNTYYIGGKMGKKGLFIKSPQIKMITSTNFHGENNLKLVVYIPYINVIPPNNYYFLLDRIVVSHIMS